MKYRMISGWVTVTGPPCSICFLKSGITDPLLPSTFPNRTATKSVFDLAFIICTTISHIRLDAPMMLVGFTALSVEISTKRLVPYLSAAFAVLYVPNTLFLIASLGLSSMRGTCLWAAAWYTMSGRYFSNTVSIRWVFRTEPMSTTRSRSGYFSLSSSWMS